MKIRSRFALPVAAAAVVLIPLGHVSAAGVAVGNSSLIGQLDYSDTFTGTDAGGQPNRPYIAAIQPPEAYVVESTYGNPSTSFLGAGFSFAGDNDPDNQGFVAGTNPYPLADAPNASAAGSDFGFTQTGGAVDYGIPYGLRDEYIVQFDAVTVPDRIDISSGSEVGIFSPNSLSVFFRGDGSGNASLFNGATDTPIQSLFPTFNTGIAGVGMWHNFAVRYDQPDQEIEIFVDEISRGTFDLTTFAGGIYQGFSNAVVGGGGSPGSGNRVWTDNIQVGAVIPEPSTAGLAALAAAALALTSRRRPLRS
ncbi:hypothetical protein BH23VER1_BH23VER1_33690 [soil metagenome]